MTRSNGVTSTTPSTAASASASPAGNSDVLLMKLVVLSCATQACTGRDDT